MPNWTRTKVVAIRCILGAASLIPHILWTLITVPLVAHFDVWEAWVCMVLLHHLVVYVDMQTFGWRHSKSKEAKILIVGGGLSGIRCATELIERGYTPMIMEKASSFGGTWNANDYPGCKSDIATSYYFFSKWFLHFRLRCCAHGYSTRGTSKWYAHTFALYAGLEKLTRFKCVVNKVVLSGTAGYDVTWKDERCDKLQSEHFDYVVLAIGGLHKPKMIAPASGRVIHASMMTEADTVSLKGKNVLIVGAASSGTQMVGPLVNKYAANFVTLCAPRGQWFVPGATIEHSLKTLLDFWMQFVPLGPAVLRAWEQGFGAIRSEAYRTGKSAFLTLIEEYTKACYKMTNLEALAPTHSVQGTRVVVDYDFFDSVYNRKNVHYVKGRISEVLDGEGGVSVKINGKTQLFDAVIMATGFETEDFFGGRLASLGLEVEDLATNFFGIQIRGLSDCFFLVGPNTITQGASITHVIEIQARAILKLIESKKTIPDSWYGDFSKWIIERTPRELTSCRSWYTNGSGHNLTVYPGPYIEYETKLNNYLARLEKT